MFIQRTTLLLCLLAIGSTSAQDVPYSVGDWPETLGNHRVRVRVEQSAEAVLVHLPWRRRDTAPDRIEILVLDAATNQRIENVLRVNVQREYGDLLFQPATAPGEYFIYYLPFRTEGPWYFPTTIYLPATDTAEVKWAADCQPLVERIRSGDTSGIPTAQVVEFQAINDFNRFDPMEVVASVSERESLLQAHPSNTYLLFPEERERPIRMRDDLPRHWACNGPSASVVGEACRGEFFAWQFGLFACRQSLEQVSVTFSDLTASDNGSGQSIPASAMRCFNLGGTDWLGRTFTKSINVAEGQVQALWCGTEIPRDLAPGTYQGTAVIGARNAEPTTVAIQLRVSAKTLEDRGDSELWRHARLRWLDSTIGLDEEVFEPYLPVQQHGNRFEILGRSVQWAPSGLPASIASTFTRNVDGVNGTPRELLAEPMRFVVEPEGQPPLDWQVSAPKIVDRASGAVTWESMSTAGDWRLACRAKLECDGYVNYWLTLQCAQTARLSDARLEIPFRRDAATYMMGLGRKGGYRPSSWQWKWDVARSNNQFWIGDVNAGLSCKLKHVEDRWDLFNHQETGSYRDWSNDGRGGCDIAEVGADQVVVRAYSGPRETTAGQELHFNFGLLITPVKTLDKSHWQWRYFHQSAAAPVAEAAETGATIINLHQGDQLNPNINYPFLTANKLRAYTDDAHARDMKVKIYYTVRELSNYTTEFWALRSLGPEVFATGSGFRIADQFATDSAVSRKPTGSAWLCEHAVSDYVPAWHQPLGNGHCDAAVATTGLSRWHNYYLEGLDWLVRNVGVDGLYLDGVGYDREIMKRVRKVLQRARSGCLIDFHSGNHYHPEYGLNNCANLYLELFPCVDSLWFGEGFDYNEPPDYWMVEMAGIPYGLFGEMLHGGGNPWRGMLYGMTSRLGWSGDPRGLWKLWDEFGIADAQMIGYWDPTCPVKTGRDDVLATVYRRDGQTLVAVASWAPKVAQVSLTIDFQQLGLDPAKSHLYAPRIAGFQGEVLFPTTAAIPVVPGRGWLFIVDEKEHPLAAPADPFAGRTLLWEEPLVENRWDAAWKVTQSQQPGTGIDVADSTIRVSAAANAAVYLERPIPAGVRLATCSINQSTDGGASWGPGMTLVWPDGKVLRVNLRAEGRFGVDDGHRQVLEGVNLPNTSTQLTIQLDEQEVLVRAYQELQGWQELARFPRAEFAGDPVAMRVGKMSPGSRNEDFSELGPAGQCVINDVRLFGSGPPEPEK